MAATPSTEKPAGLRGAIRVGIGGWTYEDWRGTFYPEGLSQKRELEYASRRLTSIEINGTYYGSQKPATFARWRDETPDGFVFSVKAPRFAMNRKVLAEAGGSITRFLDSGVTELRDKLGPINWQFLPNKSFDAADFEAFLSLLPGHAAGRALRHVVEVRNDGFRCAVFIALARKYAVAIAIAGDSDYPQIADATAPFVYARIMGTTAGEKSGYSAKHLDLWASRARAWASGTPAQGLTYAEPPGTRVVPRDVYLYVISGYKQRNPAAALALIERLG
jgi:uncharacterized protein YecE (DUF72 family)